MGGAENPAWQYAAARHALYQGGKKVELLACYEPCFRFFAEWWKQLYGESEGKEGKGLFPASVEFTADLHSMGQYIQEGERLMFETVVQFAPKGEFIIPNDPENVDGLNFLSGKSMAFAAEQAMRPVRLPAGGQPLQPARRGGLQGQHVCSAGQARLRGAEEGSGGAAVSG